MQTDKEEVYMTVQTDRFMNALENEGPLYELTLSAQALVWLGKYYEILHRWNSRIHLVAPCSPEEFATRHVLESLALLRHLSANASIAEVGAGGGLPIVPCLLVRSDLSAILIEASAKKAVFLSEALREIGISKRAKVIGERFENVATPQVDFVTCRALERFEDMLPKLLAWAPPGTTLLLFGAKHLATRIESLGFGSKAELMPNSKGRYLFVVKKV